MKKYLWMSSAAVVIGTLRVKIVLDGKIPSLDIWGHSRDRKSHFIVLQLNNFSKEAVLLSSLALPYLPGYKTGLSSL